MYPCRPKASGHVSWLREVVANMKKRTTGQDHRARRHADRPLQRAHAIGPSKRRPLADKPVEVRCLDVRVAQCGDGVGTLIVGQDEEDVPPACRRRWEASAATR